MPLTLNPNEVKTYWEQATADGVLADFDETVHPHVFMLLKYFGDFGQMCSSTFYMKNYDDSDAENLG